MTEINKDNLEKALQNPEAGSVKPQEKAPEEKVEQMKPEVEIGFHKGAVTTLANERNELLKMVQNVEAIMQAHVKRMEELGVKIIKK